jgi:hypothetical protein
MNKGVFLHSINLLANYELISIDQKNLINNIKDIIIKASLNIDTLGSIKIGDTIDIQSKIKELDIQITQLIKEGKEAEKITKLNFGPSDLLYGFYDICYNGKSREYNYDACIFR